MKRATVAAFLAGLFLSPSAARALETPLSFRAGQWDVTAGSEYFSTNANFVSGASRALPFGGAYRLIDFDLSSRYTLSRTWALFGATRIGMAESKGLDATRTSTALTEFIGGAQLNAEVGSIRFIPEFSLLIPVEKVSSTQDTVMSSEGVQEMRMRMRAQTAFGSVTFFGMVGYDVRDGGRSDVLPWSGGLEFKPGSFRLGVRIFGYQSINDDSDVGAVGEFSRAVTSLRVNAGSLRYYGVNPSVTDSEVYGIFEFNSFSLGVGGGTVLTGTNTAAGLHLEGQLTFRLSEGTSRRARVAPSRITVDPEEDEFREDVNDGIDQKLFLDPFAPAEDEVIMKSEPERPPPPPPRPKRRPHLQKQLDDAEMTIQLKVDKRRKRK